MDDREMLADAAIITHLRLGFRYNLNLNGAPNYWTPGRRQAAEVYREELLRRFATTMDKSFDELVTAWKEKYPELMVSGFPDRHFVHDETEEPTPDEPQTLTVGHFLEILDEKVANYTDQRILNHGLGFPGARNALPGTLVLMLTGPTTLGTICETIRHSNGRSFESSLPASKFFVTGCTPVHFEPTPGNRYVQPLTRQAFEALFDAHG